MIQTLSAGYFCIQLCFNCVANDPNILFIGWYLNIIVNRFVLVLNPINNLDMVCLHSLHVIHHLKTINI